jgi:hypothetical protein
MSSLRLRDGVISWEPGDQSEDASQLHRVCQTRALAACQKWPRSAPLIGFWADGGAGCLPDSGRVTGSRTREFAFRDSKVLHRLIGGATLWGQGRVRSCPKNRPPSRLSGTLIFEMGFWDRGRWS